MGFRAVIVAVLLGLYGAPGAAQTPSCDPEDPERCSTPLQVGQPAPYAGQLLTPSLAIDLGQKAMHCEDRSKLVIDKEKEMRRIEVEALRRMLDFQKAATEETLAGAQREMERLAAGPPWYERPPFVATLAVAATVGVLFLAVRVVEVAR